MTVMMDGVSLTALSPLITLTDVCEYPPRMMMSTARTLNGRRVLSERREELKVEVRFLICGTEAERAEVLSRVRTWCRGSLLTLSSHPGQRLRVRCTTIPGMNSLEKRKTISAVFSALISPYWEAETADVFTASGSGVAAAAIHAETEMETVPEIEITVTSGSTESLTVTMGEETVTVDGLALTTGDRIRIGMDAQERFGAWLTRANGTTADATYLMNPGIMGWWIGSGDMLVTVLAGGAGIRLVCSVRGRYV